MDNQLRVGSASGGLRYFQYSADKVTFSEDNLQKLPYIAMNLDQASENISGYYYAERALLLNSDFFGDGRMGVIGTPCWHWDRVPSSCFGRL